VKAEEEGGLPNHHPWLWRATSLQTT